MSILQILEKVKSTSKRTEKEQILKEIDNEKVDLFKRVCVATFDERIVYNIKDIPVAEINEGSISLETAIDSIAALSSRLVTGHDAIDFVKNLLTKLSADDAEVLTRILKRDLKCGAAAGTINKAFPDLIYEHPYMRRTAFSEKALKAIKLPAFSQTKEDGMYVDIVVDSVGTVRYFSRAGIQLPFNNFKHDIEFSKYRESVFQGEGMIINPETGEYELREDGNGYINSDQFTTDNLVLVLWDIIPFNEWFYDRVCNIKYVHRFNQVKNFVESCQLDSIRLSDTKTVNSADEIIGHFKTNIEKGLEGTIVKNMDAIWKDGTSTDEVKIKIQFDIDLEVEAIEPAEAGSKYDGMMGALRCISSDGKLVVNVGGGFKDIQRKECPFVVGDIVTVRANEIISSADESEPLSLFLPRFIEHRKDKTEADSLERIYEQKKSALDVFQKLFSK